MSDRKNLLTVQTERKDTVTDSHELENGENEQVVSDQENTW